MPALYEKDETGIVHLMAPDSGGEFTFCNRPNDGDDIGSGFNGKHHHGPSTCEPCRAGAAEFRAALKGARWRL